MNVTMQNIPSRPPVLVTDWSAFADWVHEGGYDESYLNWWDSKCLALQEEYLEYVAEVTHNPSPDAKGNVKSPGRSG